MSFHAWQNKFYLKPEIVFHEMDNGYKKEARFWGLYLTEDIKWDVRIQQLSNILNKNYYVLQSLNPVISINALRSIYFANFHSHPRYGILFWGGDSEYKNFQIAKEGYEINL